LSTYAGDIDLIISALQPVAPRSFPVGYSSLQHFSVPELKEKYPDDHLYYYVPGSYSPDRPTGLLIALHGGGAGTSRESARGTVDPGSGAMAYGYTLYLPNSPYIAVGPSAPLSTTDDARWNMEGTDEYIAAVITESQHRFAIDPNRIVLTGISMGGIGAYALGLRMADRFEAVQAFAGYWERAFWKAALGTPFHLLHGTYDSVPPGDPQLDARPHYTDVAYARLAERLMRTDYMMATVYEEHPGTHTSGHPIEGPTVPGLERFFGWMLQQKRDPYQRRVVAATPADGDVSSPHNRWVSIEEVGSGTILFDQAKQAADTHWGESYDEWLRWGLSSQKVSSDGAFVDATYQGNNAHASASAATGYNSIDGHVARYDGIDPGPDGDMTITLSHYYRGRYQVNALMVRAGRR
jgi:predicted esterase